jgi:hypothetical protein
MLAVTGGPSDGVVASAASDPILGRTLLLCEDAVFIRMDIAEILRGLGATVVEAGDGAAALAWIAAGSIDVLITDVGLPGGSGVDMALAAGQHTAGDLRLRPLGAAGSGRAWRRADPGPSRSARAR